MAAEEREVGLKVTIKDELSATLEKGRAKALKLAEAGSAIKKAFMNVAKPFLILTAAITGSGLAAFMLTKKVANAGDAMIKGAQRLTMTTGAYQKFNHIMQISGTSMDSQRGSMTRFARTARDAANGVKVAEEAFDRLNVSVKNNDGSFKTTEELIYEASDAFKDMPPTVEKSALMMDMFGRSGAELAQMLNLGSAGMKELGADAERLGGVMSEDAARGSEAFVDALTRLETATGGITRSIGESMQPMFTRSMEQMANSSLKLREAFTPVFNDMMNGMQQTAVVLVPVIGFIAKAFVGLGTTVALAWKGILLSINVTLAAIIVAMNGAIEAYNLFAEPFGAQSELIDNVFADTASEIVGEMEDIGYASFQTMAAIDDLGDSILGVNHNIHNTTPIIEENRKAVGKLKDAVVTLTDAELKAIDKLKKEKEKKAAAAQKAAEKIRERILKLADQTELKRIKDLQKADEERAKAQADRAKEALAEATEWSQMYANAGLSIGDAFTQGFADAEEGQNKFGEGMKNLGRESVMQALDIMQAKVLAYATEGAAAAAANTAGIPIIGPMLAAAAGAAMFGLIKGFISYGMSEIPGMAEGGFVTGGSPNRDSVPRMLMPGEYVMSKREVAKGSADGVKGGQTINVQISSTLPPGRAEMKKLVRQNIVPALQELKAQGMF